jgi:hypothetical protein
MLDTMGKIDDMRKLREQQFEEAQRIAAKQGTNGVTKNGAAHAKVDAPAKKIIVEDAAPAKEEAPIAERTTTARSRGKSEVTEGRCPECKKMKPVQNGVMAMHQKGMGKMCAGSRKEPL